VQGIPHGKIKLVGVFGIEHNAEIVTVCPVALLSKLSSHLLI
jgi:hypothetical protein